MSITILIVEDELILAHGLKENLQDLGYENIHITNTSDDALILSQSLNPDLFIVDVILEGSNMNGIELVSRLKLDHHAPFIYLTSMDDTETKEKAKKTKPSAYLIKPTSILQLGITIDLAIDNFHTYQRKMLELEKGTNLAGERIFVKIGDRYQKINLEEIAYLEASGSYCNIHTNQRSYTLSYTLKKLLDKLAQDHIVRTHKTFAVNEHRISSFDQNNLYINFRDKVKNIPLSRSNRDEVLDRFRRL